MAIESETFVKVIIVVLVIAVAIGGFVYFNSTGLLRDVFPDFAPVERQLVPYSGDEVLLYPGLIVYEIDGVFFNYNNNPVISGSTPTDEDIGWQWNTKRSSTFLENVGNLLLEGSLVKKENIGWINVDNQRAYFDDLDKKYIKNIIRNLVGKDGSEGLAVIFGGAAGQGSGIKITIGTSGEVKVDNYEEGGRILQDIGGAIIKLNQRSKKYQEK